MKGKVAVCGILAAALALTALASVASGPPAVHAPGGRVQTPGALPGGAADLTSPLYLTSTVSGVYSQSWDLSQTPDNAVPVASTGILLQAGSPATASYVLEPGVPNSTANQAGLPVPSQTSAYGWLEQSMAITVPAGTWNASLSLRIENATGAGGAATLGCALYDWNYASSRFTEMFAVQNSSFNIAGSSNGTYQVGMGTGYQSVTFTGRQGLFAEYYLTLSSFHTSTPVEVSASLGGLNESADYVSYPDFGWLNGTVAPAGASLTVDGSPVSTASGGAFSLRLAPGSYELNATSTGYLQFSGNFTVQSGLSTPAAISLQQLFAVQFVEAGLNGSLNWSVTLGGSTHYASGTSLTFYETSGTYNYTIGAVSGFETLNGSGSVSVTSSNRTVDVNFTATSSSPAPPPSSGAHSPFPWLYILLPIVAAAFVALAALYAVGAGRRRSDGKGEDPAPGEAGGSEGDATLPAAEGEDVDVKSLESLLELGNTFVFFEERAQKSVALFEAGLRKGLKGLCFTREFPKKLLQKHDFGDARVIWISNVWADSSIRPNDLEKINLLSEEFLSGQRSVIFIDGLESLITTNGFLSVIKMLSILRDATAIHSSILITSVNRKVITEGEAGLLRREVDRIIV